MRVRFPLTVGAIALSIAVLAGCSGEAGKAVAGSATPAVNTPQAVEPVPSDQAPSSGQGAPSGQIDSGPAGSASPVDPRARRRTGRSPGRVVTRSVEKTGWYDGFAITVGKVTAEPGPTDYLAITVNLTTENLGKDPNYPPEPDITVDGLNIDAMVDAREIPGGGKAESTVNFGLSSDDPDVQLDPDTALDTVLLTYGTPEDNQTIIPLAADAEVTSDQPITLDAAGTLQQDQIIVEMKGGTLAPSYESGEKGRRCSPCRSQSPATASAATPGTT